MDLKVPITITDELSDEVITATALLNLASGEIHRVEYVEHDTDTQGYPWESEDYEFTSGTLSNAGKRRRIQRAGEPHHWAIRGQRQ